MLRRRDYHVFRGLMTRPSPVSYEKFCLVSPSWDVPHYRATLSVPCGVYHVMALLGLFSAPESNTCN